jgi:hypothetical protein
MHLTTTFDAPSMEKKLDNIMAEQAHYKQILTTQMPTKQEFNWQ